MEAHCEKCRQAHLQGNRQQPGEHADKGGPGQGVAIYVPEVGVRQYLSQEAQGFVSFEAIRRGQVFAEQMLRKLPRRLPNKIKTVFERWGGEMDARSSTASFFAIWYTRHLVPAFIEALFSGSTPIKSLSSSSVLELMENPAYEGLVISSLESAYDECVRLMGRYPERWHWGDLHAIRFEHPLYPFAEGLLKDSMELMKKLAKRTTRK